MGSDKKYVNGASTGIFGRFGRNIAEASESAGDKRLFSQHSRLHVPN